MKRVMSVGSSRSSLGMYVNKLKTKRHGYTSFGFDRVEVAKSITRELITTIKGESNG